MQKVGNRHKATFTRAYAERCVLELFQQHPDWSLRDIEDRIRTWKDPVLKEASFAFINAVNEVEQLNEAEG